jgi:DNA-directed RNA polymerase specialized sigma24 family protein
MTVHVAAPKSPSAPDDRSQAAPNLGHGIADHRASAAALDADAVALSLFQKAIGWQDEAAWNSLVVRYSGLIRAWMRQEARWRAVRGRWDDDHWVLLAFERLWRAVPPARLQQFPTVASFLGYLKMCLRSALADEVRSQPPMPEESLPLDSRRVARRMTDPGVLAVERLEEQETWHDVAQRLSPDERLVIQLTFVDDLTPREIVRCHSNRFPSAVDVYRVKHAALKRLRRSPLLAARSEGAARTERRVRPRRR